MTTYNRNNTYNEDSTEKLVYYVEEKELDELNEEDLLLDIFLTDEQMEELLVDEDEYYAGFPELEDCDWLGIL